MKIKKGMYTIEKWEEYGMSFMQYRMAVLIEDFSYTDLVTTAIVMQVDGTGKGFATKIEGSRYFDSFGNARQEFLDDKLLHDFEIYMRATRKKIENVGGSMSNDMAVLIDKFLTHKMKLQSVATWDLAYHTMDVERKEDAIS